MNPQRKTLYLFDGTALAYRAYFAFIRNPLINSRGEDTSAAFGFTNTILSLVREKQPDYLAIVFDTGRKTFRHALYPLYKATRQKMPEPMISQVPRIRQAVDALGVQRLEVEGYEADDVIGTLAVKAEKEGFDVVMVTGDKDFMQLVGPHVTMFVPMKNEVITPEVIMEKYGVAPDRVVDLLALMGDASDNVPGIPKVGEKTARSLLEEFGSLDEILARCDDIPKPALQVCIKENREIALLSRELVTIKTDVPVNIDLESLKFKGFSVDTAIPFFREMEFTSLINAVKQPGKQKESKTAVKIITPGEMEACFRELSQSVEIAIDMETTSELPMNAEIVAFAVSSGEGASYFPLRHDGYENLDSEAMLSHLKKLFSNNTIRKTVHDAKYNEIILRRHGFDTAPFNFDTLLSAYVLEPGIRGYDIESLADIHLKHRLQSLGELTGKGKMKKSYADLDMETAAVYAAEKAEMILSLGRYFGKKLAEEGMTALYADLEIPLMEVLVQMEMSGVRIDVDVLRKMSEELSGEMEKLSGRISELAGEEFNINSPKQLGYILFEKLKLKPARKGKSGYSTDIEVLTKLAQEHGLPGLILEYRQLSKLKSTYVDALPLMINPRTGRIHTSFNQAVTSTGRLSSSDPNLQNIPIRTEMGRKIRQAFIADPGYCLLSADYSQVELRIMAHISGDPVLTEAFERGEDIHTSTASLIFNILPGLVSPEQRRQAKIINFGVMYGMGAHSLSEQLGIGFTEAREYISNYFATHSGVRAYVERIIREAETKGYVTTLMDRKRYLPDIYSGNRGVAEFAKRTAINTPIQGSAADLIKLSMINLSRRLANERLKAFMILQVHDELVLEVPVDEIDTVQPLVKEVMENAMKISVPLVVETGYGRHWLEAH
ncbi:MAG: DNA polymerase I [Candidatus Latescibacter sp.]|nr:DNA polymerase I [Candidatus Latescibacter sp.]